MTELTSLKNISLYRAGKMTREEFRKSEAGYKIYPIYKDWSLGKPRKF